MNFKKPKHEVINDARYAASNVISSAFNNLKYNMMNNSGQSTIDSLQYAMTDAISMAIESVVNNVYTDEEFEQDLNLRDK